MTISSISDLAQSMALRHDNARLRGDIFKYAEELSSGRKSNLTDALRGDFSALSSIERGLSRVQGYLTAVTESRLDADAIQSTIDSIRTRTQKVTGTLLLVQDSGDPQFVNAAVRSTSDQFYATLSALNTQIGGRSLFSGISTDVSALQDGDVILQSLEAAITAAGAVSADDVAGVVADWFAPGGDFETVGYIGSSISRTDVLTEYSAIVGKVPRGDDARLRNTIAGLAMGTLLDRGALGGQPDERAALAKVAGRQLLDADRNLIDLQSDIGVRQSEIERTHAEKTSERDSLELARSDLIGVDPFDAATRLQESEIQLRTLYALTSKLSRLSLTEYI